jgi:peroxiredoxin
MTTAAAPVDLTAAMAAARTQTGRTLLEVSNEGPTVVVFLRHAGCPFCREALADVARDRGAIAGKGSRIVLVYQWNPGEADELFERAGVGDVPRIADPDRALYRAFGLRRGNLWQLASPFVVWRVVVAGSAGHRVGKVLGDAFQMPGTFLVHKGRVIREFRHRSQAARPDYAALAGG